MCWTRIGWKLSESSPPSHHQLRHGHPDDGRRSHAPGERHLVRTVVGLVQHALAVGDRLGTLADERPGLRGLVDVDAELPELLPGLLVDALEDVPGRSAEGGELLGDRGAVGPGEEFVETHGASMAHHVPGPALCAGLEVRGGVVRHDRARRSW